MARPTKLTPELQTELVKVLQTGATIEDACTHVGIGKSTFYLWQAIGQACEDGIEHPQKPRYVKDRQPYIEFLDAITRAQIRTKVLAITVLRQALVPTEQTSETIETFSETRLLKTVDKKTGKIIQVPYEYTRTTTRNSVTTFPGNTQVAIEVLKRRYPDEWSDRIKVEDDRLRAIADIRAGRITWEALAALDVAVATELFDAAGVPKPIGAGPAK